MISFLTAGLKEKTESLIQLHFGDSVSVSFNKITIPKEVRFHAEKKAGLRFIKKHIYIWRVTKDDDFLGYAYLDNVMGKSQPITFAVLFNADGIIVNSHIVKYREPIGGEVSHKNWLNQFSGRTKDSTYNVGKDIDGISGATISVNAVSRGIQRSALITDYLLNEANE